MIFDNKPYYSLNLFLRNKFKEKNNKNNIRWGIYMSK